MPGSGRVLLVEDDAALARAVAASLSHRGWTVDVAATGNEVVGRVRGDAPDVVLLDMQLPDTSGLTVLSEIHRLDNAPPVVVVSGFLDVATTLSAMSSGAVEVLEKPVDPGHLADVLCEAREGRDRNASHRAVPELVGSSPRMVRLREQLVDVAAFGDLPVLVLGESGTGKELVAQAIHRLGRPSTPMVAINCAAMPETLFESELFGHVPGAFTGARAREGLFHAAANGTIFLDEVGEMPASLQAKLLRVLETRRFRPVGSNQDQVLHARIVSATNQRLRGVEGEALRPDLFFRLAGYTLETPPLRKRLEDVEALAQHFVARFMERYPRMSYRMSPEAIVALRSYDWPGNVRELRAVVHSAIVRASSGVIGVRHVAQALHALEGRRTSRPPQPMLRVTPAQGLRPVVSAKPAPPAPEPTAPEPITAERVGLPDVERTMILEATEECHGNLSLAARRLKIPRSTLRDKLRRYGQR